MAANDMHRTGRPSPQALERPLAPGAAFGLWLGLAIGLYGSAFITSGVSFVADAAAIGTLAGLAADARPCRRDRWIGAAGALAIAFFTFQSVVIR